jgi:hypothetical protein
VPEGGELELQRADQAVAVLGAFRADEDEAAPEEQLANAGAVVGGRHVREEQAREKGGRKSPELVFKV